MQFCITDEFFYSPHVPHVPHSPHSQNRVNFSSQNKHPRQGVLIKVIGTPISIDTFMQRLQTECPPLAKITAIIHRT